MMKDRDQSTGAAQGGPRAGELPASSSRGIGKFNALLTQRMRERWGETTNPWRKKMFFKRQPAS